MNILTFDIEEWFHIQIDPTLNVQSEWNKYERRLESSMSMLLELLEKHNLKATFFCVGWIGRNYPNVIKEISNRGHEIASHSDMHRVVYQLSEKEFEVDLVRSLDTLQDLTGKKVTSYRAPVFSISHENSWAIELLIKHGIEVDCSVRCHDGFEGFSESEPCIIEIGNDFIWEFPINSFSIAGKGIVFSGGGYFRFFPLWLIKEMFDRSDYVMTYFHPRDFDSDLPMMPGLPLHRKFRCYYGLGPALGKFDQLLESYEFIDLASAKSRIDKNELSKVMISKKLESKEDQ